MELKGTLPFVAVATLVALATTVQAATQAATTPSTTTLNPDTMSYTAADMIQLYELVLRATIQPLGPGIDCTSATVVCPGGSTCIGGSACKQCICDPFQYGLSRGKLSYYVNDAVGGNWRHRGYYSVPLGKCVHAKKIGESCEENDQCPSDGGTSLTRDCDATTKVCKCKNHYYPDQNPKFQNLVCRQSGYNQGCTSASDCEGDGFKCEAQFCKCDNSKFWYQKSGTITTGSSVLAACRRGYFGQACGSSALSASATHCDATPGTHDDNQILTCQSNLCKCSLTLYDEKTSTSVGTLGSANCQKVLVGAVGCNTDSSQTGVCYDGHSTAAFVSHTPTTHCDTTTCKCNEFFPIVNGDLMGCSKIPFEGPGCRVKTALAATANDAKIMTYTVSSSVSQQNSRCAGHADNVVCATNEDKCTCDDLYPKRDGAVCRQLYVGETGCNSAVAGNGAVEAYTASVADSRCMGNSVCETSSNTCKCPHTSPIPTIDAAGNKNGCEKVKVGMDGCGTAPSFSEVFSPDTQSDKDNRCYDVIGSTDQASTECNVNTCRCKAAKPTAGSDNKYCMLSGYGQPCNNDDAHCADNGGLGLKCLTTVCGCDNANDWWDDPAVNPKTGLGGNPACKRIDLGSTTSCGGMDSKCETNSGNVGGTAECISNVCTCRSGSKQYGANFCGPEYEYNAACGSTAPNAVACDTNMTCPSATCACNTATYPSQDWVQNQCIHSLAKSDIVNGAACTHDMNTISSLTSTGFRSSSDHDTWRRASSSLLYNTGTSNSPVLRCADANAVCVACSFANTAPKKCMTFTTFLYSGDGVRPAVGLVTLISMAALALKLKV